jgi:hypothetical protein
MAKCSRYVLRVIAISILLLLVSLLTPALTLAAVAQPDTLEIQMVQAYQNTREEGDQLYLVTCYIDYDDLPDENVDDLFIVRLLDATDDEISATGPYPFYNQGYSLGVVAFYFEPDEVPTWESNLSVQIAGNPLVDWTGDPPITTTDSITWSTGTLEDVQQLVSAKIIYLATELEQDWSVEMIATSSGMTILSDTGALYFQRVVPHLTSVAPYILGQYTFPPEYPEDKPAEDTYAEQLENAISGTIFDLSGPAQSLGISRGALTAFIYYSFVVFLFILLVWKHKLNKGTMMLAWPFVIVGAFIGVPLIVTILGGFLCLGSTVIVFHKGTT